MKKSFWAAITCTLVMLMHPMTALAKANIENTCVAYERGGGGKCSFTNTGNTVGAMCGSAHVYTYNRFTKTVGEKVAKSNVICSGNLAPYSTREVEFYYGNVCPYFSGNCVFEFVPVKRR